MLAGCPRGGEADPKRSANRLELAKDFLKNQQLPQAEAEAEKALEYDADNVEAHSVLGLVDYLRALNNFKLLEIDDCLTGVDAEALRVELEGFLTSADKRFARAVQLKPEYGEGWANRGSVALLLEDFDDASKYLTQALGRPQTLLNIGLTRANLGWAYFHLGDDAQAAKELRQAEQFNPGMCVAKYRLGRVYFDRKEWNKALDQFQAVAQNKSCPIQEAHLYLLRTYGELGMNDKVAEAQSRCLEMAPKSCIAAQCRAPVPGSVP
jgi:Tfp pilus assembly protein PilF